MSNRFLDTKLTESAPKISEMYGKEAMPFGTAQNWFKRIKEIHREGVGRDNGMVQHFHRGSPSREGRFKSLWLGFGMI